MTITTGYSQNYAIPPEFPGAGNSCRAINNTKNRVRDEAAAFADRLDEIPREEAAATPLSAAEPASGSWIDKALEYMGRSVEVAAKYYNTPGHGMR